MKDAREYDWSIPLTYYKVMSMEHLRLIKSVLTNLIQWKKTLLANV